MNESSDFFTIIAGGRSSGGFWLDVPKIFLVMIAMLESSVQI
jgi:hypothetical protein